MGRKHCGKRRKYCLPAFSPFPSMFSKAFFFGVVKSGDCVVTPSYQSMAQSKIFWPYHLFECNHSDTVIYFSKRLTKAVGVVLFLFSSPEHEVLRVSYCDHSPSVVRMSVIRPSSVHISLFTL